MYRWLAIVFFSLCAFSPFGTFAAETHPRLWLTTNDLTRLRSWAVDSNPLYASALQPLALRAKTEMDNGDVPRRDCGGTEFESYPVEMYAELFAFMSLIENDAAVRADYANRARSLLMSIMNVAVLGPATSPNYTCPENQQTAYPAYRSPRFFTEDSNRARWHGEAFPLVVDWIYPTLTAQDKQTIRTVFLRWSQEIIERGYHHPSPVGMVNDPALVADPSKYRWAGNNYFTAHMRNLGMMALSFDSADDSGGQLRAYLGNATGAWLYMFDHMTRTESKGGLLPEGYEYSPQTASYAIQFLLALQTAGADTCGRHCKLASNPFWDDFLTSFYHGLSPATINDENLGAMYQPSWYGDAGNYASTDFISAFGALGLYDYATNNQSRLQSLRWAQTNMMPGGPTRFLRRVSSPEDFRQSILYFLLFDPNASTPVDPRSKLPRDFYASGLNMFLSRTSWESDASWFSFNLAWNSIDHQQGNAGNFEWYRKGEWLTKARSGYPDIAEGIASTEFNNAITLENDRPNRDANDWRIDLWKRGSQWNLVTAGNPSLLGYSMHSTQDGFVYASGDVTNAYNSTNENLSDIVHASRSIIWIKPDAVLVYDRAQSKTANRFKRWWLQLASSAVVNGKQALATTAGGQKLLINTLLPSSATLSSVTAIDSHIENTAARGEPMKVRLRVDADGNPNETRFLHVLQAADASASMASVSLIENAEQTWSGAQVGTTLVMFPKNIGASFNGLSYSSASSVSQHLITGLTPLASYSVSVNGNSVSIQAGGNLQADSGGVLRYPQSVGMRLTLGLLGAGNGIVTSDPVGILCGTDCDEYFATDSVINLTAEASSGSSFTGWSGDCLGSGTCSVTLNTARNVQANFSSSTGSAPGAPSLQRAMPQSAAVDLYFAAPSSTGSSAITAYSASCSAQGQAGVSATAQSAPLRVSGLQSGVNYTCSVQAANSSGTSSASNSLTVVAQTSIGNSPAVLAGLRAHYSINKNGNEFTVQDNVGGAGSFSSGTLQRLKFSDGSFALDVDGNAGMAYRLYQAALDRQPDAVGVGFHLATIEKSGLTLEQVSKNFIESDEFSSRYGNLSDAQFANQLYLNVLHRQPDASGLAYWQQILESRRATRHAVLVSFSESPENKAAVATVISNGFAYIPYGE